MIRCDFESAADRARSCLFLGFSRVIYSKMFGSVTLARNESRIERNETRLERNETRLERNETRLARNETRLARNETRGGNLHLSGNVFRPMQCSYMYLTPSVSTLSQIFVCLFVCLFFVCVFRAVRLSFSLGTDNFLYCYSEGRSTYPKHV